MNNDACQVLVAAVRNACYLLKGSGLRQLCWSAPLCLLVASGTVDAPALDKRIAQLNAFSGKARTDAKSVLNHAFLLIAGSVVLSFALALLYRRSGGSTQLLSSPGRAELGEKRL